MKTKQCSRCKANLLIKFFGNKKASKDGLNYWCKECVCIQSKRYRTTDYGKEKIKTHKQTKGYKAARRDYRQSEKGKQTSRLWQENNPDSVIKSYKKYDKKCVEELTDNYIKKLLSSLFGYKYSEVPEEYILTWRKIIKVKRLILEKERLLNL